MPREQRILKPVGSLAEPTLLLITHGDERRNRRSVKYLHSEPEAVGHECCHDSKRSSGYIEYSYVVKGRIVLADSRRTLAHWKDGFTIAVRINPKLHVAHVPFFDL